MEQNSEHLVFKGMRRLRYRRDEVLLRDAMRSPYYWWWSYLRLSQDYWWVCRLRGAADDIRLAEMYDDFGNVYEMTFEQWWRRRGIGLFNEQVALPKVRALDGRDPRPNRNWDEHLLLEIPIHLTERTIISQVRRLLREHPMREVRRMSTAQRQLAKLTGIRQDVIESAHAVWQLHHLSRDGRSVTKIGQTQGTKSLYQIGKELRLVRSCMPQATDDEARAAKRVNGMKVAVSRMLTRANNLIANAAVGTFPSIQAPEQAITWGLARQQKMNMALSIGRWRPLFDPDETLNVW